MTTGKAKTERKRCKVGLGERYILKISEHFRKKELVKTGSVRRDGFVPRGGATMQKGWG